jgi:NAD(P)-dependent dehydrogenase (short-subunit alcohol dehydrogenase family)
MAEIVVIAGGTSGVGRAFARRYARSGAKVAVLGRGLDDLRQTAVELVTTGANAALMIPCDVANPDQVARATQRIEEELGPLDIWIDAPMDEDVADGRRRALRIGAAVVAAAIVTFAIVRIVRRR